MVHKHQNHMCLYTQCALNVLEVVPSNRPCFEHQIVQDEALYKCHLLLFEDPALEAQPWHEVAVGVGRNLSPGSDAVGPNARFTNVLRTSTHPGVQRFLKIL